MRGLLCLLACSLLAAGAGAQSLGEAARREKEKKRREAAAAAEAKVYGDDDLAAHRSPAEKRAGDKPSAAATGPAAKEPGSVPAAKPTPAPSPSPSWLKGLSEDDTEGEKAQPGAGTEPPSAMDELRKKIELWQGKYHPKKLEVESLEKEIAALEKEVSQGGGGSGVPLNPLNPLDTRYTESAYDVAVRELREKRAALAKARQELSDIEDGARRAGVASGQLW
jgi:hypothetical protein